MVVSLPSFVSKRASLALSPPVSSVTTPHPSFFFLFFPSLQVGAACFAIAPGAGGARAGEAVPSIGIALLLVSVACDALVYVPNPFDAILIL